MLTRDAKGAEKEYAADRVVTPGPLYPEEPPKPSHPFRQDAAEEILVTEEMIEGGFQVLRDAALTEFLLEAARHTVAEIYRAMARLAPPPHSTASPATMPDPLSVEELRRRGYAGFPRDEYAPPPRLIRKMLLYVAAWATGKALGRRIERHP